MGLGSWFERTWISAAIGPFKDRISAGIAWLNAEPGRKRTIALLCVGASSVLRAADKSDYAQGVEAVNSILQGLTTTSDIASVIMGVWGVVHPYIASYQTKQIQAVNVLAAAQKATPPTHVYALDLQEQAIETVKAAQKESVKVEAATVVGGAKVDVAKANAAIDKEPEK